jgi:enamine deaminase RidA (YjgF/YER057c/UK114 family)/energy-coupling factor transporter ATP-binding protein EcfA2
MAEFIKACVLAHLNIVISGGTGSGKTTLLNVLSGFIPEGERIVTIEDAAELQLQQDHVLRMETKVPNVDGKGAVTIRDLVKNSLRMRPDRIIVGECRGGEALDMLQAMNTGHDGSLTTLHANTPRDALSRLETMVLMAGMDLPLKVVRQQISSAVDLIIQQSRLKDGSRKITAITEVYGIEDDDILTQDIFVFEQTGFHDGKIEGVLKPTGIRPTFMDRFKVRGIRLPPGEYGIPPEDPAKPGPRGKSRFTAGDTEASAVAKVTVGHGRTVKAGGMVYVSALGPVNPETGLLAGLGIKEQANQCLRNLKAKLEAEGSSLEKIVWVTWSLRDPSEFDVFNEVWVKWFPGDGPVGQGMLMPPLQRRAGFRISIGAIAEAGDGAGPGGEAVEPGDGAGPGGEAVEPGDGLGE